MSACTNCRQRPARPATGMCAECYQSASATPIEDRQHKIPDRGMGLIVTEEPIPVDEMLGRSRLWVRA